MQKQFSHLLCGWTLFKRKFNEHSYKNNLNHIQLYALQSMNTFSETAVSNAFKNTRYIENTHKCTML